MPRVARIVAPGLPHHITQRGNNGQDIFFVDADRRAYLSILKEQSARYGLTVLGYCLMTNHVHLIALPGSEEALAKAVGRAHWLYAQYINRLHRRSGHLFQNRFYSCMLDFHHLLAALAYVERNPVRAGITRTAWNYPWSSARAHVSGIDAAGLVDLEQSRALTEMDSADWRIFLGRAEDKKTIAGLRAATSRGRPLATDAFLSKLETTLGRRLRPLPVGRPRMEKRENR